MAAPHLVVGIVGVVLFAASMGAMTAYWDDLTDTQTYRAEPATHTHAFPPRQGFLAPGGDDAQSIHVAEANVTRATARLTWQESGVGSQPHTVTAALVAPDGTQLAAAAGTGGLAGLTLEADLAEAPSPSRFRAADPEAARLSRYPAQEASIGAWTFHVAVDDPGRVNDAGIRYTLTFSIEWYTVAVAEAR